MGKGAELERQEDTCTAQSSVSLRNGAMCLLLQDQQWDYECVLNLEGRTVVMEAYVEGEETNKSLCYITCQMNQVSAGVTVPFHSSHRCWFWSAKE